MNKHRKESDSDNCVTHLSHFFNIMETKSEGETLMQLDAAVFALGFSQLKLILLPCANSLYKDAYVHSNYSKEWLARYEQERFWQIDPIFEHSLKRKAPLIWNADTYITKPQRILYEEASAYGIHGGVTLPLSAVGATGMLTCVSDATFDYSTPSRNFSLLSQLSLLRDIGFDSLSRFILPITHSETPKLSRREKECLQWHALGKTSWEIGNILNITEACVNYHFNKIRTKFNVTQRHQAVIKAITLGLITIH